MKKNMEAVEEVVVVDVSVVVVDVLVVVRVVGGIYSEIVRVNTPDPISMLALKTLM